VTYANLGTIGATVDLVGNWNPNLMASEMQRLNPSLVIVAFGTNEGFNDATDPALYPTVYDSRLNALRVAAPHAAFLIAGPPDGTRMWHAGRFGQTCANQTDAGTNWVVPPRLPTVRAAQRQIAVAHNYYFWDWSSAMGGQCSINTWTDTDPPMAAPDHVHLLSPGYRATADALFREIMHGYDQYRAILRGR
jgi:lysophospholipase L1-like esterase